MTRASRQPAVLTAIVRGSVVLALLVPSLWTRDIQTLVALVAIGAIWVLGSLTERRGDLPPMLVTSVEAAIVGVLCGWALEASPAVLGTFMVGPLAGAVHRRLTGMVTALAAQLGGLLVIAWTSYGGLTTEQMAAVFTWSTIGLGFGFLGTFMHGALAESRDPLTAYRSAHQLLHELLELSDDLEAGLDPVFLGGQIVTAVRDELPVTSAAVHVPREDTLVPLLSDDSSADEIDRCTEVTFAAWGADGAVVQGHRFAFPLKTAGTAVAVVCGALSDPAVDPVRLGLHERLKRLTKALDGKAVQLDTALLFAALRENTTAEERSRLAREMHDGVAQDIASLGYLVDALRAKADDPQQSERLGVLRDRLSSVVSEIRRSVVTLRTSVGQSESLGAAISTIARNLSDVSGLPIHVTLDEMTERLRPEVEAELFRITQEAINNAVKHSGATAIEVHCQVRAPEALITVTDNGHGLHLAPRSTSQGMKIMHERAALVDADLGVEEAPGGGLRVVVRLPARRTAPTTHHLRTPERTPS